MVKLPDDPMQPRHWDRRVGFFSVGYEDYSSDEHEVENVRYVTRWRIGKKNPDAAISDPVKPIVYYLGREIPEKWRSYVAQGVEDWQVAFEQAGFSNAILAMDPPSMEEDPDWDAEDARYSTIRWLPSTIQNAFGPHIHDPRTGEILEADIRFYHNVIQLARNWYFVQASPMDVWATLPTLELAARERVPVLLVLNRVIPRANLTEDMLPEIKQFGAKLARTRLGNRVAFAGALADGLAVSEMQPYSRATQEIRSLAREVLRLVK